MAEIVSGLIGKIGAVALASAMPLGPSYGGQFNYVVGTHRRVSASHEIRETSDTGLREIVSPDAWFGTAEYVEAPYTVETLAMDLAAQSREFSREEAQSYDRFIDDYFV